MNKGKTLLGLLTGIAAGAMLGILFAPAKGSETRRKISEKGNEFAETLKRKLDNLIDGINDDTAATGGQSRNTADNK